MHNYSKNDAGRDDEVEAGAGDEVDSLDKATSE